MRALSLLFCIFCLPALATNIQPDKPRTIQISAKDVNRVTCVTGLVQDAFFSEEKVNQVTVEGNMVFIKLPIKQDGDTLTYATNVVDFDIICDGQAYKFFAEPKENLRGQIIYLGDPEIQQALSNLRLLDGMDKEDQYQMLMDAVLSHGRLNNHLFTSLVKEPVNQSISLANRTLVLQESYRFNGAGLRVKHYLYPAKQGEQYREEQFLLPQLSTQARAITVHPLTAMTDGYINVLIIEEVL
ncbi:TraK domain-containing protein [Alteromonas macleodii]|uniref:TraK family protein n=1 Tax=Alteromonas macleodii TaxID=28108 RepID=A0AB36FP70_ALTMA|nr:type-F conjugative transfer system secretin TraK [Alteromonas macleodii]OES24214.1 traK family protein [Alteromonas macleodii]OES24845.1 traK family protein [Alteromonas macleodii]OES25123.1 traK family protein [Alteromonas macleodii]OES39165.1 traK family protein [Alteromonas macleodii]